MQLDLLELVLELLLHDLLILEVYSRVDLGRRLLLDILLHAQDRINWVNTVLAFHVEWL